MTEATPCFGVLGAFVAFVDDHKRCGDLDGGLDQGHVWMACSCGAQILHPASNPALDLHRSLLRAGFY
jgi:hypothetical protein